MSSFLSGIPSRRTNDVPESRRGLGHVTPTIFGIRSNISLKLLELETSNLVHGFVWSMPIGRTNKFPWKWAWSRSCDPTIFGSTVGYPSDSLASCFADDTKCITGLFFSARQQSYSICLARYMLSPVRPSVCPSLYLSFCPSATRVDHRKMVEVRIMKFSPQGSPMPLFCEVSLIHKFWGVPPERRRQTRVGWVGGWAKP